jgi:CcmD family protein
MSDITILMIITLVIWLGLFSYLWKLDRKIKNLLSEVDPPEKGEKGEQK